MFAYMLKLYLFFPNSPFSVEDSSGAGVSTRSYTRDTRFRMSPRSMEPSQS